LACHANESSSSTDQNVDHDIIGFLLSFKLDSTYRLLATAFDAVSASVGVLGHPHRTMPAANAAATAFPQRLIMNMNVLV